MNVFRSVISPVKRILLPTGPSFRRIRFRPLRGTCMKLDFQTQLRQYFGLYEIELRPHFRRLALPGMKCFDVGAFHGYYALFLAKRTGGPVVSFECVPEVAADLRETVRRNPFDIRVIEGMVSDRDGDGGCTLDAAANEHFVPDFVKMDIEGWEASALRGAERILSDRRPHWIIETHGKDVEDDCARLLRGHGYDPLFVNPRTGVTAELRRTFDHNRWLVAEGRS